MSTVDIYSYVNQALSQSSELDSIYKDTWQCICDQHHILKDLAIKTLSWVLYAKRSLTWTELQHALSIQMDDLRPPRDSMLTIEDIVSSCCGLLAIDQDSNLVRLEHRTAAEYFASAVPWKKSLIPNPATMLANACVTYLSLNVFGSGRCTSDIEFEERLATYPFYSYASSNWGYHAILADNLDRVRLFLQNSSMVEASGQALFSEKRRKDDHGYSQRIPEYPWSIHLSAVFGLDQPPKDSVRIDTFGTQIPTSYGSTLGWSDASHNKGAIVQLLLETGAISECQDNNTDTPLEYAAKYCHIDLVRLLLEEESAGQPEDIYQNMALLHAAARGHAPVVELLLQHHGCSPSSCFIINETTGPIYHAANLGHEAIVRLLLETWARVKPTETIKPTLIKYAIERELHDIVKLLCASDQWSSYVLEKLHSLVQQNRSEEILQLLRLDPDVVPYPDVYRWAVSDKRLDAILLLLQRGSRERFGRVAWEEILLVTIKNGDLDLSRMILNTSPQLSHWRDDLGRTVLFHACNFGEGEIIKALVDEHKADINAQCNAGRTPLLAAAYDRRYDVINILLSLQGIQVDTKDHLGRDVLSVLSEKGHRDLVQRLLGWSQIDPDSSDGLRRTPLSWAAAMGCAPTVTSLVNTELVDVDHTDTDGRTPLFWACARGHGEATSCLLLAGCNVNLQDKTGQTALHIVAQNGSDALCKMLLDKGADTGIFDHNQNTALMLALRNEHNKAVRLLQQGSEKTLCFLARHGRHEELQSLLEKGFNVNTVDRHGRSLIILSVINQAISVLQLLIKNTADVSLADVDGLTPLQHAVQIGDCESIHELLRAGSPTTMISARQWLYAFSKYRGHMMMTQDLDGMKSISFYPPNENPPWPKTSQPEMRRSLL